jgi:hypothetical protein
MAEDAGSARIRSFIRSLKYEEMLIAEHILQSEMQKREDRLVTPELRASWAEAIADALRDAASPFGCSKP